jgi:hypothetical protein
VHPFVAAALTETVEAVMPFVVLPVPVARTHSPAAIAELDAV